MITMVTVNARFANGVLTPLEPIDLPEGALVVLNIEAAGDLERETPKPEASFVPNQSGLLPGMDNPKRMKQLLDDEDVERYLRLREQDSRK